MRQYALVGHISTNRIEISTNMAILELNSVMDNQNPYFDFNLIKRRFIKTNADPFLILGKASTNNILVYNSLKKYKRSFFH